MNTKRDPYEIPARQNLFELFAGMRDRQTINELKQVVSTLM